MISVATCYRACAETSSMEIEPAGRARCGVTSRGELGFRWRLAARWGLLLVVAVLSTSCSARLHLRSMGYVDGDIVRSTDDEVVVATESGERVVARQDIQWADHPGLALGYAGASMVALGSIGALTGYALTIVDGDHAHLYAPGLPGVGLAAVGYPLWMWGSRFETDSRLRFGEDDADEFFELLQRIVGFSALGIGAVVVGEGLAIGEDTALLTVPPAIAFGVGGLATLLWPTPTGSGASQTALVPALLPSDQGGLAALVWVARW